MKSERAALYDVCAVELDSRKVLWVERGKTVENADAVIRLAIARQGIEDRFFARTEPNRYVPGDPWVGGAM